MENTEKKFSIAGANFKIKSNFEIESLLYEPQPYNLHINYLIKDKVKKRDIFTIVILRNNKNLSLHVKGRNLTISGKIDAMFEREYNPQFGLFGNKGIIHHFILHTLENYLKFSFLHASAILHPHRKKYVLHLVQVVLVKASLFQMP